MKTVLELANEYLEQLALRAEHPWDVVIARETTEVVANASINKIKQMMTTNFSGATPWGTFVGNATTLTQYVPDVLPSQEYDVVQVLKNTHRIVQVGKGKGVCLVLPFAALAITGTELEPEYPPAISMISRIELLVADREVLASRLDTALKHIEALQHENVKLRSAASANYRTTWS